MQYYIYQIINSINNKFYIGVHKTTDLNDGYMGSGTVIRSSMQKHGIDNFLKVILEFFDTPEAMYAREKEIVNDEFLLREDTYNLRRGGIGGWDHCRSVATVNSNKSLSKRKASSVRLSKNLKELHAAGKMKYDNFLGKNHTEETKLKIKNTFKSNNHQQGSSNSQFGTMWITDGISNKKIKKDDIIPDGWNKGRIVKSKKI